MDAVSRRITEQHKQHLESTKDSVKFADFSGGKFNKNGWFASGNAFSDGVSIPGDWSQAQNDFIIPIRKKMAPFAAVKTRWVIRQLQVKQVFISPYSLKEGAML